MLRRERINTGFSTPLILTGVLLRNDFDSLPQSHFVCQPHLVFAGEIIDVKDESDQ